MSEQGYLRDGMPFNIGWWGFTFRSVFFRWRPSVWPTRPHLEFLRVIGAILVGMLTVFWIIVSVRTVSGACRGDLFYSPAS